MEIVTPILGGLGLFFVGMRGVGASLQQLAGRRMRAVLRRATASVWNSAAIGASLEGAVATFLPDILARGCGRAETGRAVPLEARNRLLRGLRGSLDELAAAIAATHHAPLAESPAGAG